MAEAQHCLFAKVVKPYTYELGCCSCTSNHADDQQAEILLRCARLASRVNNNFRSLELTLPGCIPMHRLSPAWPGLADRPARGCAPACSQVVLNLAIQNCCSRGLPATRGGVETSACSLQHMAATAQTPGSARPAAARGQPRPRAPPTTADEGRARARAQTSSCLRTASLRTSATRSWRSMRAACTASPTGPTSPTRTWRARPPPPPPPPPSARPRGP